MIPSINQLEVLQAFENELDTLIKIPKNIEKTIRVMERLLEEDSIESTQIPQEMELEAKVKDLRTMMNQPSLTRINIIALKALKNEMRDVVADKIEILTSLKLYKKFCQEIFQNLSEDTIQFLITATEGFYLKGLLENLSPKKALHSALVKGILYSFIGESDPNKNLALRQAFEIDPGEVRDYTCIFTGDLVGADAVFLRGETGNVSQRYHRSEIKKWISIHHEDPMSRAPRTEDDIVDDPNAELFIKHKIESWIDSKTKDIPFSFKINLLADKNILLAIATAHPLVKKEYESILEKSYDLKKTMEEIEAFTEETLELLTSLTEGIKAHIENAPVFCYPYLTKFISQAAEEVKTGSPLNMIVPELGNKIAIFVNLFYHIQSTPLAAHSREEVIALVTDSIDSKLPTTQIMALFSEYMDSLETEKIIRQTYPGCLMGSQEWLALGVARKTPPLPKNILKALNEPSPSNPLKKAWETGMLVLIPETIDGEPLTLNRLGELTKKHFPETGTCFRSIDPVISIEYGNTPVDRSHFVFIEKNVLPRSKDKSFQEQSAMIRAPYKTPELLPMAVGIVLKYLNSEPNKRLFSDNPITFSRCKETFRNFHVIIGGFTPRGFAITYNFDHHLENNGIGCMKTFP